jgi:hypothetical protein
MIVMEDDKLVEYLKDEGLAATKKALYLRGNGVPRDFFRLITRHFQPLFD